MSEQLRLGNPGESVMHYSSLFFKPVACGADKPTNGPLVSTGTADCVTCPDCRQIMSQPGPNTHERDSAIAQAEWEVVEAAVARREAEKAMFPFSQTPSLSFAQDAPEGNRLLETFTAEQKAVDRLLSLRQEAEKENADVPAGRSAT